MSAFVPHPLPPDPPLEPSATTQAELERVFDPFYRVEGRGESRVAGAGLGLAIVRHLVAAHGGEVGVTSAPGEGSTFVVRLPAAASEAGE